MTTHATHAGTLALHAAALSLPPRARRGAAMAAVGGTSIVAGALLPWMTFAAGQQSAAIARGLYGTAFIVIGVLVCLIAVTRWFGDARWARLAHASAGMLSALIAAQLYVRAWRFADAQSALTLVPPPGIGLPIVMLGGALVVLSVWRGRRW